MRKYRLGAAFIWSMGEGAVAYFSEQRSFLWAGLGGLIAGWVTASLLALVAKFGAGKRGMMIAGMILGVLVASGAVSGLQYALAQVDPSQFKVNWDELVKFLYSWSLLTSAVLGLLTGLYVRARVQRPPPPESAK